MSSPSLACFLSIWKMMSCLRVLEMFSRPISWADSNSSEMDFVLSSDRFIVSKEMNVWKLETPLCTWATYTDVQWVSFGSKVPWRYDLSIQAYCKDLLISFRETKSYLKLLWN